MRLLGADGAPLADGRAFDAVVLACHAAQSLEIVAHPRTSLPGGTQAVGALAGALARFDSTSNEVVVHTDVAAMPLDRRCWAAWNYLAADLPAAAAGTSARGAPADRSVTVTYYANALQAVRGEEAGSEHLFVTLNPPDGMVSRARVSARGARARPRARAR